MNRSSRQGHKSVSQDLQSTKKVFNLSVWPNLSKGDVYLAATPSRPNQQWKLCEYCYRSSARCQNRIGRGYQGFKIVSRDVCRANRIHNVGIHLGVFFVFYRIQLSKQLPELVVNWITRCHKYTDTCLLFGLIWNWRNE